MALLLRFCVELSSMARHSFFCICEQHKPFLLLFVSCFFSSLFVGTDKVFFAYTSSFVTGDACYQDQTVFIGHNGVAFCQRCFYCEFFYVEGWHCMYFKENSIVEFKDHKESCSLTTKNICHLPHCQCLIKSKDPLLMWSCSSTLQSKNIFAATMTMTPKFGRLVTYLKQLLPIMFHDSLIAWSCEIMRQTKNTVPTTP